MTPPMNDCIERVLREYKFDLPSTALSSLRVTPEIVTDPGPKLQELLAQKDVARSTHLREELDAYAASFAEAHGLQLSFTKRAAEEIVDRCVEAGLSVRGYFDVHFRDLEYGLKLLARNTGKSAFTVTVRLVERPGEELARLVTNSFRAKDP